MLYNFGSCSYSYSWNLKVPISVYLMLGINCSYAYNVLHWYFVLVVLMYLGADRFLNRL